MRDRDTPTRRRVLAAGAALGTAALAGCSALSSGGSNGGQSKPDLSDFRGSSPLVAGRPKPGGTPIADLPDLSGDLTLYIGGGEGGLYQKLAGLIERYYDGFTVHVRFSGANQVLTEGKNGRVRADVFWANDAGSLGTVADAGLAADLPADLRDLVPQNFRAPSWVGLAGRARSIPYDTDRFSKSDVPNHVAALTDVSNLDAKMGWAPTYPAFQSFVTAMRVLRGGDATRAWLNGMQSRGHGGMAQYKDEWYVANAVADGEIAAGFANHYYALRVKSSRPDAPIELAFTKNDAGALVNVAGAALVAGGQKQTLAANFVRHLLSAEAQEFFATVTFGYPVIAGVAPVGGLPTIDDLDPPALDLTALGDLQPTLDLMREVGVL